MSDSTDFSLVVIDKRDLPNYFGETLSELLAGEPIPLDSTCHAHFCSLRREMKAWTRGGWFHQAMKALLDASDIDGLRFLTSQTHTHEFVMVDGPTDTYPNETRIRHRYTVVRDDHSELSAALSEIVSWCETHADQADKFLVLDYPESTEESMLNAFFTLRPNSDILPGDEGQGSLFVACVLRTMGDLVRYAKHQGLWVVYDSTQLA